MSRPGPVPKRVIGYARVSSVEQSYGSSLEDQKAALSSHAASRGLKVTRFYIESESGGREKIEKREQMQALIGDIRPGDLILCDKIDRWSRDPEFTYRSVRELLAAGANFYAVGEGIDPSTNEGDSAMSFRILFAREEHKRIRQRTVGTRNLLRDRGYYVEGTPPYGYRRAKPKGFKGVEKNVLVIEPDAAAKVREMFRLAARGRSLTEICAELGVAKKRVWSSLRCRTYLGEIRTSKGWIRGPHEPIIAPELFAMVQEATVARRLWTPRPRSAPSETSGWVFRSLVRCGLCGHRMGGAYAGPHGANRRHYYRCLAKCTTEYVRVPVVEALIDVLVVERLGELREELSAGPELTPAVVDFEAKRKRIAKRREALLLQNEEGLSTIDELRAGLARLDAEKLRLDAQEGATSRQHDPIVWRSMLREMTALKKAWAKSTIEDKRRIAAMLMSDVRIAAKAPPSPTWFPLERLVRT